MRQQRGFTLVETLIATALLAVALVSLARLLAIAVMNNATALDSTVAVVLAAQQIEHLRSLTWKFDDLGLPDSDPGLARSPSNTLQTNTAGYVDYLDADGVPLGTGTVIPGNTAFIRRWSIEPLPGNPDNTLAIQVMVTRSRASVGSAARAPGEARLLTLKTRKRP